MTAALGELARSTLPNTRRWMQKNLFSSLWNVILTGLCALFLGWVLTRFTVWALTRARWAVLPANFRILMVGPYPSAQMWRVWTALMLVALTAGAHWGAALRSRLIFRPGGVPALPFVLAVLVALGAAVTQAGAPSGRLVPVSVAALLAGFFAVRAMGTLPRLVLPGAWLALLALVPVLLSADFGSGGVNTSAFGGLLLTLLLAVLGIAASFPLGVVLAVGRVSRFPLIRGSCAAFIEAVRGTPLVVMLFTAQLFVPLLFGAEIAPVWRALVGISVFSAAYLAENLRGGLQSVPPGQTDAARALGLSGTQTLLLIVLPQALRAVLPVLAGQFISLLKDTSLITVIGLHDLTGITETIRANPAWIGRAGELAVALAVIYFMLNTAISHGSRRLEEQLDAQR